MAPRPLYICSNCRFSSRLINCTRRVFSSSHSQRENLRPPTAPKPTPDVKHIRQNADLYAKNCLHRNYPAHKEYPARIQQLLDEAKQLDQDLRAPRSRIKQLELAIAKLSRQNAQQHETGSSTSDELASLQSEAQRLKENSQSMIARKSFCDGEAHRLALCLPNLTSPDTPVGDSPRLVRYMNFDPQSPPEWLTQPDPVRRSHVAIGTSLGLLDFTSSATTTGWGWYFLINEGAQLEQALVQYALSIARRHGWKQVSPPSIVYSHIAEACGFQPRDHHNEQQIWTIEQNDKNTLKPQRALAGTAEIPLAAMYAARDIPASDLPVKVVGASRCYRAEAGSRGVDTKGLYRVHEFTKVELFGWSDPSVDPDSAALFASLLDTQAEILTSLGLPCRVLEMPSTDLGASAFRKLDIEALFPSRIHSVGSYDSSKLADSLGWGEVTSASICTDYQSRRLGTRVRDPASRDSWFPHTINGTAMAIPRVLAAILENWYDPASGVVVIPPVLRNWMDGLETIGR